MNKKFAVVLAGCGNKDGAEIQEAVLTLLAIDQEECSYQCFAPDVLQGRTLNFITNKSLKEKRNVLVESARIARIDIKPLDEFNANEFDIIVFPGGSGVAHNLCTYAKDGIEMTINVDVVNAITSMHQANKPIGALCISPVIVAKLIPYVQVTFGKDEKANEAFSSIGVNAINSPANKIVIDEKNKVVTTPCYMQKTHIAHMFQGISRLVKELIRLSL